MIIGVKTLENVTFLNLHNNKVITDDSIKGLINLISLDLTKNKFICNKMCVKNHIFFIKLLVKLLTK